MNYGRIIESGSNASTVQIWNGKQIYPCRCGKTHTGDYGASDFAHHNCFHECKLLRLAKPDGVEQVICPDCGELWEIDQEKLAFQVEKEVSNG